IDKAAGAEREVIGRSGRHGGGSSDKYAQDDWTRANSATMGMTLTVPATDAARRWAGWGTALKPAWEIIVLARKPLDGTVATNVQAHGTGALNVDATRVGNTKQVPGSLSKMGGLRGYGEREGRTGEKPTDGGRNPDLGRFPPNLL